MKILILFTRLTGYWMNGLKKARDFHNIQFDVYRTPPSQDAPFVIKSEEKINIFNVDQLNYDQIINIHYDLIYTAGWNNKSFLKVNKFFKSKQIPTVMGMDNQWFGSIKQKVAEIAAPFYLQKYFSKIWVSGLYQFPYAQRLGFSNNEIVTGLYCADDSIFNQQKTIINKRFVFIGRLVKEKGLDNLIDSFLKISNKCPDWTLEIIGNGPLKDLIPTNHPQIRHIPFIHPNDLQQFLSEGGVFTLPSIYEPWGVVIHEAVLMGMPIISTYESGATTTFVENGYNGFLFNAKDKHKLTNSLLKMIKLSVNDLLLFSKRSLELSKRIESNIWANKIYNLANEK
ncbi:glycosyltransferase [Flammeovirga pacifica]|uniref:Glycosyl transferase family 1 domain-containing protein n=1 Tax=Flammeovirga pacifica TaxID=915059 RepID=A0A1S1YV83_FLAPC|nr:glycosyltransferase [Flammeovirga pacifica]OHX64934.1 hypothetical protein NH26_00520 [Flammeovirga pacifica]